MRHLIAVVVHHNQLARCDQLDALARFDRRALARSELAVLRQGLADRDKWRGLGQPIYLRKLPAELALDPLDCGGRRRRAGGEQAHTPARIAAQVLRCVGDADQHGRRGAEHADLLAIHQLEDCPRLDFGQAYMFRANRRHNPHKRPAIGVEHRQCPQVAIMGGH